MTFSKIAPIVLYVVIGITILVMFIFYAGSSIVNQDAYNAKVSRIESSAVGSGTQDILQDLRSADSLSGDAATSSVSAGKESVKLNFLEKLNYFKTDIPIVWAYILVLIALIVALVFPLIQVLANPSNLLRSFLVLVGVIIVIGLAYLLASGAPVQIPGYTGDINTKPFALKIIDTSLIFTYLIFAIALLSIFVSQLVNYFK